MLGSITGFCRRERTDTVGKRAIYKHYSIRSTPLQRRSAMQWTFSIAIYWERDGKMTVRSFSAENTYSTEAEADLHGIAYGQQIMDGKVPGCSVD